MNRLRTLVNTHTNSSNRYFIGFNSQRRDSTHPHPHAR